MELLKAIIIIFSIAIIVLFLCNRVKIPAIVGYLITGILTGPYTFGIISNVHEVETLSEIGVILLLFTIGMEFSIKNLLLIKRSVIGGGFIQVVLTTLIIFVIFVFFGKNLNSSLFYGFLVSLSSTAIVLKIFQERSEVDTPHGKSILAILIFQDIIVVPMMLITPILAGSSNNSNNSIWIFLIKSIGLILFFIVAMKWVIPWMLYQITKTRSRELFILSIVVICFSIAWLTYSIGLSLALGAFLAGLVLSETEYSHEAISNIIPFRDIFTSIFFISIGMLLNLEFIMKNPLNVTFSGISILVIKSLIAILTIMILGLPLRTALLTGFAICQIGEFSFILSKTGLEFNLINNNDYQLFLSVSIFTMLTTPFIIKYSIPFAHAIEKLPIPKILLNGFYRYTLKISNINKQLEDHIIIVGFGVNGKNVSRSAKIVKIPYIIIEMNPDTVKTEQEKGEIIIYGDASHEEVLDYAQIDKARIIVIAIPDAAASRRIVSISKKLNSSLYVIARTRYVQEVKVLYELGADEVIPEEFETSIQIFTRVLNKYQIPLNDIKVMIDNLRLDGYSLYRRYNEASSLMSLDIKKIPNMEFVTLRVEKESIAANKTIAELDIRKKFGITIIVIYRNDIIINNPDGESYLYPDDILLIFGSSHSIANSLSIFNKSL